MRVTTVDSSTIATVAYDETRKLLQLGFCTGAVYQYFGVPAAVHQALLDAPSLGKYFNRAIRKQFPYRLLADSLVVLPDPQAAARSRS